jgi:hypothetical protein
MATHGPGIGPFEIPTELRVPGRESPNAAHQVWSNDQGIKKLQGLMFLPGLERSCKIYQFLMQRDDTIMTAKTKQTKKQPQSTKGPRKSKFQADRAPTEDRIVRSLKQELHLSSNTDFLSDALAFRWAVGERRRGHHIFSETETGERKELVFPRLERVAPEVALPRVEISWAPRELESLADLASREPAHPTETLIRAVRG